jgi:hypothetical protein
MRNTHFINVFCITEKIILGIFKKKNRSKVEKEQSNEVPGKKI